MGSEVVVSLGDRGSEHSENGAKESKPGQWSGVDDPSFEMNDHVPRSTSSIVGLLSHQPRWLVISMEAPFASSTRTGNTIG